MKTEEEQNIHLDDSAEGLLGNFELQTRTLEDILAMKGMRSRPIVGLGRKVEPSAEAIAELLLNGKITKSTTTELSDVKGQIVRQIDLFLKQNRPIEFCLIAFSPKSHSPLETGMRRLPDLGEMMFLRRLLDIDLTVKQIFAPGAHFTICYEGFSFADRFGNPVDEVRVFKDGLQKMLAQLNGTQIITLDDLHQITSSIAGFDNVCLDEEQGLRRELETNLAIHQEVHSFLPVMRRASIDLSGYNFTDLLTIARAQRQMGDMLTGEQKSIAAVIEHKALENAIFYTAFGRARRNLKVMENTFPDKIYISVTAKPGRLAIHPINASTKIFPHHGVPVLGKNGLVEIIFFHELIDHQTFIVGPKFLGIQLEGEPDKQPFFFQMIKKEHQSRLALGYEGGWY